MGIWDNSVTPAFNNYALLAGGKNTYVNVPTDGTVGVRVNNGSIVDFTITAATFSKIVTANAGIAVNGSYLYGPSSREWIRDDSTWLRLNQGQVFSEGIHTPGFMNIGNGLTVGGLYSKIGGAHIGYMGNLRPYRNGQYYTGYVFVPLSSATIAYLPNPLNGGATANINVTSYGIPAGAVTVVFLLAGVSGVVNSVCAVYKTTGGNGVWETTIVAQVANVVVRINGTCNVGSDNLITVYAYAANWSHVSLTFLGYYI